MCAWKWLSCYEAQHYTDVLYGVVKDAVEGTIAIEVLQWDFNGKIIAQTTSILNTIVLYDSQVVGDMVGDGTGAMELMRSIVSVYVRDKLLIVTETSMESLTNH